MNQIDGFSCLFNKKPKKIVILLHGYGDHAENFISLANDLNDKFIEANFYAPNAPFMVPQYPLGRQWFNPYPNGIHYNEAGAEEKLIMQKECEVSIKELLKYIDNLCLINNLLHQDCFLIGFSQGAMIAYELGHYINQTFAGCIMLSGRILSPKNLANRFFVKTPLLIMHGDQDEIVNPRYFTVACDTAESNGFKIENYLIKGEGHTISSEMLKFVQTFIKKYV